MINAVTGVSSQDANSPTIADSIEGGEDLFLQLLVAQVRYQDPLEPMNNNEYLAQTAQFTMVEQITKLAEQQTELLAFQRATLAAGMVGQTVAGIDETDGRSVSGVVDTVEYNFGDPQLVIGDQRVGLDEVISTGVADNDELGAPALDEPAVADAAGTDESAIDGSADEPAIDGSANEEAGL